MLLPIVGYRRSKQETSDILLADTPLRQLRLVLTVA